ncbi:hypothetical protein QTP86_018097, partial [Hemibagrus guttatus]
MSPAEQSRRATSTDERQSRATTLVQLGPEAPQRVEGRETDTSDNLLRQPEVRRCPPRRNKGGAASFTETGVERGPEQKTKNRNPGRKPPLPMRACGLCYERHEHAGSCLHKHSRHVLCGAPPPPRLLRESTATFRTAETLGACFTDDVIATNLHLSLTHLDNKDTYVRMLFIDFSSAFNTIIPQHLIEKLSLLGLNTSLCNWILDFLTGRPQSVRIRNSFSSTTTLSTGAPQGCVLSSLLFTLLTHDCEVLHSSNHIVKFADDTTVVDLISKNDEDRSPVEIVNSTKFLGVHLAENFTWSLNTTSISKKAQQDLYFLRSLKKAHLPSPILTMFYRGTIESVLSSCITAWFGNCTVSDRKTLQWIVRIAEKIIGISLPSITDMYTTRCICKANSIVDDPTHPSHTLFTLLPSWKEVLQHSSPQNQ